MDSTDETIRRISTLQAGAFTLRQARDAGISANAIYRRRRRAVLHRLHPTVYFGGHVVTLDARRWGAVLAAGPGAALITGEAALDDWGVGRRPSDAVEIVVERRQRPLVGVDILQSSTLHPEDHSSIHGRPTATVERALVDVAGRRDVGQLCQLLREAAFWNRFDVERLRRTIERNRTRAGVGRLRRALVLHLHGDGGSDSGYEDAFARLLERHGVTEFARNVVLVVHGEELRVDVYVEHLGLVVEIDPEGHDLPPMRREDRLRAALCRVAGIERMSVRGNALRAGAMALARRHREWVARGRPAPPALRDGAFVRSGPAGRRSHDERPHISAGE